VTIFTKHEEVIFGEVIQQKADILRSLFHKDIDLRALEKAKLLLLSSIVNKHKKVTILKYVY